MGLLADGRPLVKVRRRAVLFVVAAVLVTTVSTLAMPAGADDAGIDVLGGDAAVSDEVFEHLQSCAAGAVQRLAGRDRYATAAAVSQGHFASAESVFIATGENFPDAAAAGSAAARVAAPILLVRKNGIPAVTAAELSRLGPTTLYLLGGPAAIAADVETQLQAYGTVVRLAGPDRYGTAAEVSRAHFAAADVVYVATGERYLDAITGSVAAARDGGPMLLVRKDAIPAATAAELARLAPSQIVVLGGTSVVSDAVATALEAYAASVTRLAGPSRYSTAAAVSQHTFPTGAAGILVATADNFPDALVGGAAGGHLGFPVLLVSRTSVPSATANEISRLTGRPCQPFTAAPDCPAGIMALTYDDGPIPTRTNTVLAALDRAGIRATFFVVGYLANSYPEMIRRAANAGHVIANHTYQHQILIYLSDSAIRSTITRADAAIRAAGVSPIRLVRPPGGNTNTRVRRAIESAGFRQVLWTSGPLDYDGKSGSAIANHVIAHAKDQANIVLHDGSSNYRNTAAATEIIVRVLRDRGYCFGVLDGNGRVVP